MAPLADRRRAIAPGTITKALSRLVMAADRVIAARPRWSAFGCGVLSTLAMPPVFGFPVLFVTLFGLVRLIDAVAAGAAGRTRLKASLIIGWLFGFGYFLAGLYWISASLFVEPDKFLWLLPFSASLIPAGLAVFHAAAVAAAAAVWHRGAARIVVLALAFTAAEWLRGHVLTGLPWNTLGYALTAPPLLMQSAAVFGTYALTFLTVVLFALPATAFDSEATLRERRLCIAAPLVALALLALFGAAVLSRPEPPAVSGVRLRLVQPNVSQDMKWRHENRESIFRGYLELSRRNPSGADDGLAGITHLIWPESAIPFLLLNSDPALEAVAGLLPDGTHLVTGAIRLEMTQAAGGAVPRRRVFNSILALDDRANLTAVYDKVHLVPFGEYLPMQALLESIGLEQLTRLQGGFATGTDGSRILEIPGLPSASPLICYESIFPDEVVQRGTNGRRPAFFLNVTNDGWFGRTAGPHQHLHQARIRAVEQGIPLVRVANTGMSAIVDGRGRIVERTGLNRTAVIDADLPGSHLPTIYGRLGETITLGLLMAGLALMYILRQRN